MADSKSKIRSGVWRCRSGFFARNHIVPNGAVVPRDVPYEVLDGNEQWFEEVEHFEPPVGPFKVKGGVRKSEPEVVEQATAAPGEKRPVGRPRKTT